MAHTHVERGSIPRGSRMFTFITNFIQRGFTALHSYISWQLPLSNLLRLVRLALLSTFTLLAIGFLL